MISKEPIRHATATDVARLAGVSQSAVSRAFTPGASVAPGTRKSIQDAAIRLGYRPNLVARSLISGRSNLIGVVVPGTANPFYSAALDALSLQLAEEGYKVLLFTTDPVSGSDPAVEEVLNYRVDALVLISCSLSSRFAEECQQLGLPVVMLNRKTDSGSASSVTGDNKRGSALIAAFLLAGGHKRFAFLAGLESSSTSRDREAGFMTHLASRRIGAVERRVGNYNVEEAEAAVRSLLSIKARPDALFCANDYMALCALKVATYEFGLEPGRDISIVGFDNVPLASWPQFSLTSYSQPIAQMVNRAVELLRKRLKPVSGRPEQIVIPGALIVRGSTRKPKTGMHNRGEEFTWRPRRDPLG